MCARLEEIPKLHAKMSNAIKRIITVISLGRKFRLLSRYPHSLSFETAAAFGTKSPDVPRDFVTAEGAAGQGRGGRIAGSGGQTLLLRTGAKQLKAQPSRAADGLL